MPNTIHCLQPWIVRQSVIAKAKKKETLEDLKRELKELQAENSKLHIQVNQMRMKPKWKKSPQVLEAERKHQAETDRMRTEIHKQIMENKPTKSLERQDALPIGHNMALKGEDLQEFIDPDLLENGDGSID